MGVSVLAQGLILRLECTIYLLILTNIVIYKIMHFISYLFNYLLIIIINIYNIKIYKLIFGAHSKTLYREGATDEHGLEGS